MNTGGTEILGSRYRILKPLGGGGMKSVYLAEDLKLNNRLCAVAAMIDNFADPGEQRAAIAAFQREADMLAAVRNEHIPQIYDKFSEQQSHYLVMEFIEGETLESRIRTAGKLSELEIIDIAIQILDTLEYLHGLNPPVIYRDMKPSNVMTTPEGKVKLIDFGIARFFQSNSMTTMGTSGYAPPEQYSGKAEQRSDLYALAVSIHEALTGRTPVPFDFPPLSQLRAGSNRHLSDLLEQALADNVNDRIPNACEFKRRLLAIKSELKAPLQTSTRLVALQGGDASATRTLNAQPGGQTWVFNDTTQMSDAAGQSASVRPSTGRQSFSQNISPGSSVRGSRGLANNTAAAPGIGSGNITSDGEQTAILNRGLSDSSVGASAGLGSNGHTWVFQGASERPPNGHRSMIKMIVGLASIATVAFAAVTGINQWNDAEHAKALIAAHQAFEQQQQMALQEAERQKEILLQQAAQSRAELRKQQQREIALERRREWEIRQAQQQARAHTPYAPPQGPGQTEATPAGGMGQVLAEGVAGAIGGAVGATIGQVIAGGISGSGHGGRR